MNNIVTDIKFDNVLKELRIKFEQYPSYDYIFYLNGNILDEYLIDEYEIIIKPLYYYFTSMTEMNILIVKTGDNIINVKLPSYSIEQTRARFKLVDILLYDDYFISFDKLFTDDINEIREYDLMRESDLGVLVYNDLAIFQGIENILNTSKGEKLFDMEFGSSFNELVFSKDEDFDPEELKKEISNSINRYEQRVMTKPELIEVLQYDNAIHVSITVVKNSTKEPLTYSRVFTNT